MGQQQADCLIVRVAPVVGGVGLINHVLETLVIASDGCFPLGPFRVYINQPHLNRTERMLELARALVALLRQPYALSPQ